MVGELDGVAEAYRPPNVDDERIGGPGRLGAEEGLDYVVSTRKLVLLYVATLGLYGVYWFYKHWQHQKLVRMGKIWPLPRAILSVLYVASLFKQLDVDARSIGHAPSWSPAAHAALYIVANVAARVLDRLSGSSDAFTIGDWLALLLPLLGVVALVTAQKVVNTSVGDPHGSRNDRFGAGELIIITAGAALWLLIGAGALMPG